MARVRRPDGEPHHIDVGVGKRLRAFRRSQGLSQSALAEAIGLTFQQVQKYENGANRISCSKLWEISQFMKVPMYVLLGEDPHGGDTATPVKLGALSHDAHDLALAYERVESTAIRAAIRRLVGAVAHDDD